VASPVVSLTCAVIQIAASENAKVKVNMHKCFALLHITSHLPNREQEVQGSDTTKHRSSDTACIQKII